MKDRIDDFVLGAMTADERAAMQAARRADSELDREIEQREAELAPLALALPGDRVPSDLWERIADGIAEDEAEFAGRYVEHLAEGDWHPLAPGIERKFLRNENHWLLRCKPGTTIPEHLHDLNEVFLVISGDISMGGRRFESGDFVASAKDSIHNPAVTKNGCVALSIFHH